ncbi:MAG: hypothetical protein ACI814_001031 [Mariniblastus sp.]|jgi:hypothetical protein
MRSKKSLRLTARNAIKYQSICFKAHVSRAADDWLDIVGNDIRRMFNSPTCPLVVEEFRHRSSSEHRLNGGRASSRKSKQD